MMRRRVVDVPTAGSGGGSTVTPRLMRISLPAAPWDADAVASEPGDPPCQRLSGCRCSQCRTAREVAA